MSAARRRARAAAFTPFYAVNGLLLLLFSAATFLPIVHVVFSSVTSPQQVSSGRFIFYPEALTDAVYRYVLSSAAIMRSVLVSALVAVLGTTTSMVMTVLLAYPLSRPKLRLRRPLMTLIVVTMYVQGGLIPTFLVIRLLGLTNTLAALFVPAMVSSFNLIIVKNFFAGLPAELEESARIEGANDLWVLFKVILPVSTPVLATFTLFYLVEFWNTYMAALFYVSNPKLWTLQLVLRNIILSTQMAAQEGMSTNISVEPDQLKSAVIVIATLPMLLVYPFLQRYFAKGIMLGAVKG